MISEDFEDSATGAATAQTTKVSISTTMVSGGTGARSNELDMVIGRVSLRRGSEDFEDSAVGGSTETSKEIL